MTLGINIPLAGRSSGRRHQGELGGQNVHWEKGCERKIEGSKCGRQTTVHTGDTYDARRIALGAEVAGPLDHVLLWPWPDSRYRGSKAGMCLQAADQLQPPELFPEGQRALPGKGIWAVDPGHHPLLCHHLETHRGSGEELLLRAQSLLCFPVLCIKMCTIEHPSRIVSDVSGELLINCPDSLLPHENYIISCAVSLFELAARSLRTTGNFCLVFDKEYRRPLFFPHGFWTCI